MQKTRSYSIFLLIAIVSLLAMESPADAYYGHRNYRRSRGYNPYGNKLAAMQRANAAINAAQARVYAAQTNLSRLVRQARLKAENSPAVTSAKSDHTQSVHDYQAARSNVIANLKANNSEFSDLLKQCQILRDKFVSLSKSGETSADLKKVESELHSKARRVTQIENEALNADPTTKEILGRQASSHSTEISAKKDALNSVSQDPTIKAAQQKLAQAQQQAQLVANRYNSTLASANSLPYGGRRSYRRGRVGYGAYGYLGVGSYHRPHHTRTVYVTPAHRRR